MEDIYEWQTCSQLAKKLGCSQPYVRKIADTDTDYEGHCVESRPVTDADDVHHSTKDLYRVVPEVTVEAPADQAAYDAAPTDHHQAWESGQDVDVEELLADLAGAEAAIEELELEKAELEAKVGELEKRVPAGGFEKGAKLARAEEKIANLKHQLTLADEQNKELQTQLSGQTNFDGAEELAATQEALKKCEAENENLRHKLNGVADVKEPGDLAPIAVALGVPPTEKLIVQRIGEVERERAELVRMLDEELSNDPPDFARSSWTPAEKLEHVLECYRSLRETHNAVAAERDELENSLRSAAELRDKWRKAYADLIVELEFDAPESPERALEKVKGLMAWHDQIDEIVSWFNDHPLAELADGEEYENFAGRLKAVMDKAAERIEELRELAEQCSQDRHASIKGLVGDHNQRCQERDEARARIEELEEQLAAANHAAKELDAGELVPAEKLDDFRSTIIELVPIIAEDPDDDELLDELREHISGFRRALDKVSKLIDRVWVATQASSREDAAETVERWAEEIDALHKQRAQLEQVSGKARQDRVHAAAPPEVVTAAWKHVLAHLFPKDAAHKMRTLHALADALRQGQGE